ncbi:family transcriptional regulator [Paramyrothecium foliicola]|nr:family transcriptional regulator [Paramyrothecium foliicola]
MAVETRFTDDASRWAALVARDTAAEGHFVYAVKSTKIYCRPVCKARLARRANVTFYATGSHAQRAGFRACKRCKPELAGRMPEEAAMRKIRGLVQSAGVAKQDNLLTPAQMAERTGLSRWHFHRVFKKCTGVTPAEYLKLQRTSAYSPSSAAGNAPSDSSPDIPAFREEEEESSNTEFQPWRLMSMDDLLDWPDDDRVLAT